MRHNQTPTISSDLANLARFCEAAHPSDIGLQNIHSPAISEVEKFKVRILPFARRNANGRMRVQKRVTIEVINVERRFQSSLPSRR